MQRLTMSMHESSPQPRNCRSKCAISRVHQSCFQTNDRGYLGTRLNVRMRTKLENGVLCYGKQPGSAENSFFDHSKFEGMKSLSAQVG